MSTRRGRPSPLDDLNEVIDAVMEAQAVVMSANAGLRTVQETLARLTLKRRGMQEGKIISLPLPTDRPRRRPAA